MEVYAKTYLDGVIERQGEFFDYFNEKNPGCDTADFIEAYMKSTTRRHIDDGQSYVLTMDPEHLWEWFIAHDHYVPKPGAPILGFAPDWIGRFYALYQWTRRLTSAETIAAVPLSYLVPAYRGLHDLDLDLAVAKVADCH